MVNKRVQEAGIAVASSLADTVHPAHARGKLEMGERISIVQEVFGKIFNEDTQFQRNGSHVSFALAVRYRRHDCS